MSARLLTDSGRCVECGRTQFRVLTDGMGRAFDAPNPCACYLAAMAPKPKRVKRTPAWRAGIDNARRLASVCQLCDEPVDGKPKVTMYCAVHRLEQDRRVQLRFREKVGPEYMRAVGARYADRNRQKLRKKARAYGRKHRDHKNEYKRLYRLAYREKVRLQKERAAIRSFRDPQPGVKRWRAEVAAGLRIPKPARRNKHGERLCCNGLCRQVVASHARMCERCKARLAVEASTLLQRLAA